MKVVIVGGVAGGATAAARLRRLDESAEIIILERSGYVSYANCGLPYYVGHVIEDAAQLTLQTPEQFRARFGIDVRVHHEVTALHPQRKSVSVRNLESGAVYEESYDKLLLSPGAKAVQPPLPGADDPRVFTLRTVEDTLRIRQYLDTQHPKRALIIGGGFIGLEAAENLMHAGVQTTLVQLDNQLMPPLDYDMATALHAYLREKGLQLYLQESAVSVSSSAAGLTVQLKSGKAVETDLLLVAVGVAPDTKLAKEAGLTLGIKDSIVVDEHMQTSVPDIYAVGDAVQVRQFVTGQSALISLAGPANKQGRIAADNLCGIPSVFRGTQGASVLKLFDMTVASTGINEKTAAAAGLSYDKVVTFSPSHATYYPGATNMTIKTLFEPETGRILGAQITGFEGVDKRIDDLSIAIRAHMTAADLAELELSYAPPYSSAKDPVNMAGFVIENVRSGLVKQCHWDAYAQLPRDGSVQFLDVRTAAEVAQAPMPGGTIHIPLDVLREHLHQLRTDKPVYVNCYSGLRSYLACRILSQHGFICYNLSGGSRFYQQIMDEQHFDAAPRHACGIDLSQ